ncbi:MAG: hypothetical protein HY822_20110 [Acidobacteria bacterium]|nr:hypothetical protein [Acidobacteriota bacterium]
MTRREAVAALGAAAAGPAILQRHDQNVARLLERQVTDPRSRWCGSALDDTGLCNPHPAGGILESFTAAFLHPDSKFHQNPLLIERMRLAARHLLARQNREGNIDLVTTNFNSPPDTGFVVHNTGTAACLMKRHGLTEMFALLEPFLRQAGAGLVRGGVHTPNHRWVVCSALAQINDVLPHPDYVRRIDQWLAEGIDIDADGQYSERSTLVYNIVCNRALIVTAAKLKRLELVEPVRRNLNAMLYLLHPDDEVVTEISRRQDLNTRGSVASYWFALQYMALHDNDGRFAALARRHEARAASLSALMEYPELAQPGPPDAAIPEDYERALPALGIARIRRGLKSATLMLGGSSRFFVCRHGDAVVNAVRFASAFFGKGQFVPQKAEKRGGAYHFEQKLEAGYYQPLDPPRRLSNDELGAARAQRKVTELCRLEQSAVVSETARGFDLRLRSQGTSDVPLAVEINLREGGRIEGCEPVAKKSDAWVLESGHATYRLGRHAIRFGPGAAAHRYIDVRGAEPKLPGPSVYLTGLTPFDRTIRFEPV